jgi:hypothetical protein
MKMKLLTATLILVIGLALIGPFGLGPTGVVSWDGSAQAAAVTNPPAPQAQAPGWSRGQQNLALSYDDCVRRMSEALQAEGYNKDGNSGGNFVAGTKAVHTAVIICSPAPEAKMFVQIVVASNGDGGGRERQCLQAEMERPGSGCGGRTQPPVATGTCTFQYQTWDSSHWTARIDRGQFVHAPNGDFGAAHRDTIIRYLSWDGNRWTAKISGDRFVHAPNEDWNRAHDDVILNYINWNGAHGTVRISDCGVTGIP